MKSSCSTMEDAEKRVNELEELLESKKLRIEELEEQINSVEVKCENAEAESKKYSDMISELNSELEKFKSSVSGLESALDTATEKEMALTESLNVVKEERRISEEASEISMKKLNEVESLLEALRNELSLTQGKLEAVENDLKASGMRESEILEKLKSAKDQLELQKSAIEEATARKVELETLHESTSRDFDLKMHEAMTSLNDKDSEAKLLNEKLQTLGEKVQNYEKDVSEAALRVASLIEELHQSTEKVGSLEISNEKLKKNVAASEGKVAQSLSENELLMETNSQLKSKIDELQELLNSAAEEKEASAVQLSSHVDTITDLTDKHSRSIELHTVAEARLLQAEEQLNETRGKLAKKETEATELSEKLNSLETQIKKYEEEAREASEIAESRSVEIEQLRENVVKLADKEAEVKDLNERLAAIEDQAKLHREQADEASVVAESRKVEIGDMIEKLGIKESELKELNEKLIALEGELTIHQEASREASGIAESRKAEIEQLQETVEKLAQKELEVEDLNEKLSDLEDQIRVCKEELSVTSNIVESRKVEIEEITEELSQKELEVKELSEKLTDIEGHLKSHQEEAREIAELRKVENEQWRETMEKLTQKELEATELIAQISGLENRLRTYQEQAESRKLETEETVLKLRDQGKMVEEMQAKLGQIETRNEALAEANMKLTQDLALSESDQSDLHSKLSRALAEKDSLASEYDLSKTTIEDLTLKLASEKQRLQSEVKNLYTAASTREVDLNLKLEQHVQKLQDRDLLNERVSSLEQELQLAENAITKLKEENSAKVSGLEAERSRTSAELEAKSKEVVHLGKKVDDLEKKLQEAETTSKQKGNDKNEAATQAEVRSRDIDSMLSTPSKRKSSKSEKSSAQPLSSSETRTSTTTEAPAASMNAKFILGVALVSIIVGVILGKRY